MATPTKSAWQRLRQHRNEFVRFGYYMFNFAASIPLVITFNNFVAEVTSIQGASMYPFFNAEKDQTTRQDLVLNFKYNAQYSLQRGMIVTFWNPLRPEAITVKRIIGLPGDVIKTRSPYPVPTVKVPPGHVWVGGDGAVHDSKANQDSNTYGPISTGLIIGKVTHILMPLHRAGRVRWWEFAEKMQNEE